MAKKTLAMLAMDKPPGDDLGDESPMEDEGDMGGEAMEQAMADFLDAVKADDPAGMAQAVSDAVAMADTDV